MKLSMSMIHRQLRDLGSSAIIENDRRVIEGVRFLTDDMGEMPESIVFIGQFQHLFPTETPSPDRYILVHGTSHITVRASSYEEVINAVLGAFDYYLRFERELIEAAARKATAAEIIALAEPVLESPMTVSSYRGALLAISAENPRWPDDDHMRYLRENGVLSQERTLHCEDGSVMEDFGEEPALYFSENEGDYPLVGCYVLVSGERVAGFTVQIAQDENREICRQLAGEVAHALSSAKEFQGEDAVVRTQSSVLLGYLDGLETQELKGLAVDLRTWPPSPWRLALFAHSSRTDAATRSRLIEALGQCDSPNVCVEHEETVVALASDREFDTLLSELARKRSLAAYRIGLSTPFTHIDSLPLRKRQALFALESSAKPGVSRCEDHAMEYLVSRLRVHDQAYSLAHPALDVLSEYDDAHHGIQLHETLYQFLRCGGNMGLTADTLFIHRNSLTYRLTRIKELTGLSLEDPDENMYLLLSLLIDGRYSS